MDPRWGTRLIHRMLIGVMRVVGVLVPEGQRDAWRAEWDGELWYGVLGRPRGRRWTAAVGLARGMLQDALEVRREGDPRFDRGTGGGEMGGLVTDIGYGARVLRKSPGFTSLIVLTVALGIGGAVTIFSVVNSLLIHPLPYPDADRLVMLWEGRRGADVDKDWFSGGHFTDIRDQTDVFDGLTFTEGGSSTLTGRRAATEVGWLRAPSDYLRMLGADALLGRIFDEQDDRADATPVALLTHDLWQRAYGGDPDAVGRSITLDGRGVEVVGVLSPALVLDGEVMPTAYGSGRIDVVLSFPVSVEILTDRLAEGYNIVGKLAPGVTLAQAQAQLDRVAATIQRLHEDDPESGFFIRAVPLLDEVVGSVRRPLVVLLASVGGVLLIVCVNVANLLLARGASRRRELGVRAAMGAEHGRLARQLLTESATLAVAGGLLGVGLAAFGLQVVKRVGASSLPRIAEIGIDHSVLIFSTAITVATCLVFGLVPAWRVARVDVADTLRPAGRSTTEEQALWSRLDLPNALVVAEIGLALVLLVGGGLLLRSFIALEGVDPGFHADGRLTFRLSLSGDAYGDRTTRIGFFDELERRLQALPGVESVGAASHIPFDEGVSWGPMAIGDYVPPQGEDHQIISDFRIATPGYFRTLGIPVLRGRAFDDGDDLSTEEVALIDEHFADLYFPGRDPVGMQLVGFLGRASTIIGVVGDVKRESLERGSRVTTYRPQGQWGTRRLYIVIATRGDPEEMAAPATRAVAELDGGVAVVDVRPMTARLGDSLASRRFSMALLQVLGLVALVLATVGIYGLMSYRVSRGARDLGVRIALGASPERILKLVLSHGLRLATLGVATGMVAALALTRTLRSMLFGVGAVDAPTYAAVAIGLVLTALLACYVPARRATRVDPRAAIGAE